MHGGPKNWDTTTEYVECTKHNFMCILSLHTYLKKAELRNQRRDLPGRAWLGFRAAWRESDDKPRRNFRMLAFPVLGESSLEGNRDDNRLHAQGTGT